MYAHFPSAAEAVGTAVESAPPDFSTADFYGHFIQVIIALIVIIGMIVLLIRFLAARNKGWRGEKSLRVMAGVALGQNKSLQIVKIGDSVYIVGVGENITLLDKIDDREKAEELFVSLESPSAPNGVFDIVSRLANRFRKGNDEGQEEWESQKTFRDMLNHKLNGIGRNRKAAMKAWMDEEETPQRSEERP